MLIEGALGRARIASSGDHAPLGGGDEATDTVFDDGSRTEIDPAFESDTHVELPDGRRRS